jgi:hypothetical protein
MLQQFTAGRSLADKVSQQLVETTYRLCRKFAPAGGAAAEVVRGQVTEVRAGFGSLFPANRRSCSHCRPLGPAGQSGAGRLEPVLVKSTMSWGPLRCVVAP